jgi:hypothetical protein
MMKSIKNLKKRRARQKAAEPRSMQELQQANSDLLFKVGQIQYQIHAYGKELARLNKELENLNYEGAARMELDKKLTDRAPVTEQVTTAPSEQGEAQ